MKQRITASLIVAAALVVSVLGSSAVLAQGVTQETPPTTVTTQQEQQNRPQTEQVRQTREQRVQQVQRTLERCEQIKTRLAERATKAEEVQTAHTTRYERLVNRVDAVIASAESRGYDTAGLVTSKEAVEAALTAYGASIETYTAQLETTSGVACDQNASTYAQAIVTSRETLEAVRTAGALVKTTFRQNVVPELQKYKTWLEENATTTEERAE